MEHIRQYDWCSSEPDINFLLEEDMDNCAIERIILNAYHDPMIPKITEEDQNKEKIDWNKVFRRNEETDNRHRVFVAGMRAIPKFPKLSALTKQQHHQLLKVICAENPDVLALEYMSRPTKSDQRAYEQLKETYEKEQQEFIEWAKNLWVNQHCVRALRPKPTIETVYDAEFKKRAAQIVCFPKKYEMAAQIQLSNSKYKCDMVHRQDLINVYLNDLAKIQIPDIHTKRYSILNACPVPEPCDKHPCWFVLPNEKNVTVLPLTEIHRELAQYALDNGAKCIASENALKCLLEKDRSWLLPVSVCQAINVDGDKENILVIGSEFETHRDGPMMRTYRAYRHLLDYALIPSSEKSRVLSKLIGEEQPNKSPVSNKNNNGTSEDMDVSSDEDEGNLVINEDINMADIMTEDESKTDERSRESTPELRIVETEGNESPSRLNTIITRSKSPPSDELFNSSAQKPANSPNMKSPNSALKSITSQIKSTARKDSTDIPLSELFDVKSRISATDDTDSPSEKDSSSEKNSPSENNNPSGKIDEKDSEKKKDGFYNCTCKGSAFEVPPPRSFRRWEVRNWTDNTTIDIIVHCSHKMKAMHEVLGQSEVIAEPIVDYQIDLGGSVQSEDKVRSLALSLLLRKNASLLNVRVDCASGEVIRVDNVKKEQYLSSQGDAIHHIANVVYSTFSQLQDLLPGRYILQHPVSHGANASLLVCSERGGAVLECAGGGGDEAAGVRAAPTLAPVLLPAHKFRKILPCAFPPYENMVAKETKKPPPRTKPPPQALRWPKRKRNRKKKH